MDSNAVGVHQLGSYPLLARLGSGGMGTVYLALHRGMGGFEKKVAIKALLPHIADDKQFISMLVDEAKLTAQLTHPNIVQVMDLAHADQCHFLVMEYVEGVDARTLSDDQELTLDEAVYLVAEAARGLAYAHRKCGPGGERLGIVHRDVSGHNLLVSVEGVTKVMDFGIAKAASNRHATEVGVLKGKLAYMSPEQALGRSLDARSDLFSLGIVLWELCTRQRLFAGDTEMQILLKVQKCEIEPPSRFIEGFPRELEDLILKCLAVNPEHRYSDGDQLADELHGFLRSHQGAVHPRAKLAHRVSEHLRNHPIQRMGPPDITDGRSLLELTQASSRNDRTRITTPVEPIAVGKRAPVLWRRWMAVMISGLAAAGLVWFLSVQPSGVKAPPVPTVERANTAVIATSILPPLPQPAAAQVTSPVAAPVTQVVVAADVTVESVPIAPRESVSKSPPILKVTSKPTPKPTAKPVAATTVVKPRDALTGNATLPASPLAGTGYVSINATPWARVYIDGVAVAESTPLLRHALSAGEHKIVLVNPELKIRKELQMSVLPGEHIRKKIILE